MSDKERFKLSLDTSEKLRKKFVKFAELNGYTFERVELHNPPYFGYIMLKDGKQITNRQRSKTACLSEYINTNN